MSTTADLQAENALLKKVLELYGNTNLWSDGVFLLPDPTGPAIAALCGEDGDITELFEDMPVIHRINELILAREKSIKTCMGRDWNPRHTLEQLEQDPGLDVLTLEHWAYLGRAFGYVNDPIWAEQQFKKHGAAPISLAFTKLAA